MAEGFKIASAYVDVSLNAAGVTAQLAAITGAAGAAGAALAAVPAAGIAAAGVAGVLAGSFSGVGDALKAHKNAQDASNAAIGQGEAGAKKATKATQDYDAALRTLLPSQQEFVLQLISMEPAVGKLKAAGADAFLPGLTQMLKDSQGLFPIVEGYIRRTGESMAQTARDLGTLFKSEEFQNNLDRLFKTADPIINAMGDSFVRLLDKTIEFGANMGPAAQGFADFVGSVTTGLEGFFTSMEPYANDFKVVWDSIGRIFAVVLPAAGLALGELARMMAPIFDKIADFLEGHRDSLDEWLLLILGFYVAIQGAGVVAGVGRMVTGVIAGWQKLPIAARAAALRVAGAFALIGAADTILPEADPNKLNEDPLSSFDSYTNHQREDLSSMWDALLDPGPALADMKAEFNAFPADFQKSPFMVFFGTSVPNWWNGLWGSSGSLQTQFRDWTGRLKGDAQGAVDGVSAWFSMLPGNVGGWFSDTEMRIGVSMGNIAGTLWNKASEGWTNISIWFSRLPGDTDLWFDNARVSAFNKLSDLAGTAWDKGSEIWNNLSTWWGRLSGDASIWFGNTDIVSSNSLSSLAATAWNKATEIWNNLSTWFGRLSNDASVWFGNTDIVSSNALASLAATAWNKAVEIWNNISTWFGRLPDDANVWFTNAHISASNALSALAATAWNKATEIWNNISTWFGRLYDDANIWFGNAHIGAGNNLSALAATAWNKGVEIWNNISTWFGRLYNDANVWFGNAHIGAGNALSGLAATAWNKGAEIWRNLSDWFGRLSPDMDVWMGNVWNSANWALNGIARAFDYTKNFIRDRWNEIREATRAPIQWVVDVVYNRGLRPAWNNIARVFSMSPLDEVRMARGGVAPGSDLGFDYVPALLRGGEGVLVPEATRALGGEDGINRLNRWAEAQHFAKGGIAGWKGAGSATATRNSATGSAQAVGSSMNDWLTNPGATARRVFAEALGFGNQIPGRGMLHDAMAKIPGMVVDAVVNKAKGIFSGGGALGAYFGPVGGRGVQRWTPLVLQALRMMGQPASLLQTVLRRMNQESGGNPNIVNNWDINARRGIPSGGLMQTILPTFRAFHFPGTSNNMFDPLANILASMRYAISRYGSLSAAYNKRGGYDDGGLAMGMGMMPKYTTRPERVLNPQQTAAFERAMDSGFKGGGDTFIVNFDISKLEDISTMRDFATMVQRSARRGPRTTAGVR